MDVVNLVKRLNEDGAKQLKEQLIVRGNFSLVCNVLFRQQRIIIRNTVSNNKDRTITRMTTSI